MFRIVLVLVAMAPLAMAQAPARPEAPAAFRCPDGVECVVTCFSPQQPDYEVGQVERAEYLAPNPVPILRVTVRGGTMFHFSGEAFHCRLFNLRPAT